MKSSTIEMAKLREKDVLTCKRCGYKWTRRIDNPLRCPNCKSGLWNITLEEVLKEMQNEV